MASIPPMILCNFSIHDGFNKVPRNISHAKGRSFGPSLLQNKLGFRACLIEHRQRRRLMGLGEIGMLASEKALNRRRRVVRVRGLKFNGGDNNGNGRILGNLALAIGLTYLSMTGQLGWILDAIVSVWLIVVIVPILGLGAFLWWAQRDIVQSNCPNCGYEFQIFKSATNDEVQLCPFCTQPFSVVDDKFVKEPVKFSNQTTAFGQDLNGFSSKPKPKKGKGSSTAVVDIEAEVTDAD
ncbi:unnamed protein product [Arabidopsis lyrata]|uniref:Uncharacterized protein n=1 Tax=Arabidopsis lyrata subsp. lyrata TaxID=81972 RepID=D7MEG1_ARALL|nr:uncharacterized protein LOC9303578 [Arabidopsis lyrata subsp. lyrata]EFH43765.1 hypothetical protein ARALYDRAFT_913802 [Arabidopsis lyrata subsp. lyrata]CAH8275175.1 unnamed protein product [Arabidopsis lyrata]|eukprot:XP_002867506.1 uncharacterized protein LOC9303578 [Arabidopsis lyrata subsp. lyrata]